MKILNKIEKQLTINEGFYNIDDSLTLSATCTNEINIQCCYYCDGKFQSRKKLKKHMKNKHNNI